MSTVDISMVQALIWPSAKVGIVEDDGLQYLQIADNTECAWVELDKDIAGRIIDALHGYLQDQMMENAK